MEHLIKKAQTGDKEAFIQAINQYMTVIYKVAKTRLNSEEDIGDAVQDTILAAYKNLQSLKAPQYFKTWIIRILINKCNDIAKRSSRVTYIEDYSKLSGNPSLNAYDESVEDRLSFDNILRELKEEYRTAIILYYVNGFTTREISEILGEREGTIKSRLSRARQQLKSQYVNLEKNSFNSNLEVSCND